MAKLELWQRPNSYMGPDHYGYFVGPGQNRDSDALSRSNFRVALEKLGGESECGLSRVRGKTCMTKAERLRLAAKRAAEFRGHVLTKFEHKVGNHKLYAECINCRGCVVVLPRPFPNETEISGDIVAVHCKGKK